MHYINDVFGSGHLEILLRRNQRGVFMDYLVCGVVTLFKHQVEELVTVLQKISNMEDLAEEASIEDIEDIDDELPEEGYPTVVLSRDSSGIYPIMIGFEGTGANVLFGKAQLKDFISSITKTHQSM